MESQILEKFQPEVGAFCGIVTASESQWLLILSWKTLG
jgi:hypothetical protein